MKIASIECLELLFSKDNDEYFCVTNPKSSCFDLIGRNYPKDKIISVDISSNKIWRNEKKIISKTNLTDLLHQKGANGLILDPYSSSYVENWAGNEKMDLVVTPYKLQRKLENKIFFELLLKKHNLPSPKSWIIKSEADIDLIDNVEIVAQRPNSNGSRGTFFVKNKNEIRNLIKFKKLKFPFLCREFINNGIPLGVSILISPNKMIFSALRAQAYFSRNNGESVYYGIQWVRTSFFPKKTIEKLNTVLNKIGGAFQKIGFCGVAGFDLIIRNDEVYFIECNPRLSGATPQISLQPELLHGLNFAKEFTDTCLLKELSVNKPFIPNSNYEGFNLDLDFLKERHIGTKIRASKVGFYKPSKDKFTYISAEKKEFDDDSSIFLYHALPERTKLSDKISLGFIMKHKPLLKLNKNSYSFSEKGQEFLKNIENLIIRNESNC